MNARHVRMLPIGQLEPGRRGGGKREQHGPEFGMGAGAVMRSGWGGFFLLLSGVPARQLRMGSGSLRSLPGAAGPQ